MMKTCFDRNGVCGFCFFLIYNKLEGLFMEIRQYSACTGFWTNCWGKRFPWQISSSTNVVKKKKWHWHPPQLLSFPYHYLVIDNLFNHDILLVPICKRVDTSEVAPLCRNGTLFSDATSKANILHRSFPKKMMTKFLIKKGRTTQLF